MAGAGQIDGELVEAELAVGFGVVDGLATAGQAQLAVIRLLVQQSKRRGQGKKSLLQPVEGAAEPGAEAVQGSPDVAGPSVPGPARFAAARPETGQIPSPFIPSSQCHGDRRGGHHAGLWRCGSPMRERWGARVNR